MINNNVQLTPQQKANAYQFLSQQGYFVLPRIFDDNEIEKIRKEANEEYMKRNSLSTLPEKPSFKMYQAAQNINAVMNAAKNDDLLNWLDVFLGPNILLALNRHNHISTKLPGEKLDKLHRDHGEWSRGMLTAIIYCEEATLDSGCTQIIPGSHLWYSPGKAINGGYWLEDPLFCDYHALAAQAVPVPVQKGGVLLFNAHVFHMAGENKSNPNGRLGIALGYYSVDQLSHDIDPTTAILVKGENIYRGND